MTHDAMGIGMQYHLNGFRAGDPAISEANGSEKSDEVDVLIVGCGPAGLTLAAQLSAFSDISVRIAERKPGPLLVGQADGIACRSVEMFEAFGFAERVVTEGYHVNEVCFWRPVSDGAKLERADRIKDVEDGLSEMPHIILSQARIHDFFLEIMANSPNRLVPNYSRELVSLTRLEEHAITASTSADQRRFRANLFEYECRYSGQLTALHSKKSVPRAAITTDG